MPYISSDVVKEIRKEIKLTFPKIKFSVTRENHSSVVVAIMESEIDFGFNYKQLNHYHLENNGLSSEAIEIIKKILTIINSKQEQKELVYDSDYGSVPTFYINIHVGKWDKPYKKTA